MTLANQIVFITASLSSYILSLRNFTKTRSEKTNTHDAVTPFLRQGRSCGSKNSTALFKTKISRHILLIFHSFYFLKVNE